MAFSSLPVHRPGASFSTPVAAPLADRSRRSRGPISCHATTVERCRRRGGQSLSASPATPLLLVAVLCLMAALVAPEQPQDQEAICQRHNGASACRVW